MDNEQDVSFVLGRAFNRAALVGVVLFVGVVGIAVVYQFPHESAPFIFFSLGAVLCIVVSALIYQTQAWRVKASSLATILAEEEVRSSRDLFTEVYQHSPVPYLLIAKNGQVESVNTAAMRLFKLQPADLLGKDIFPYVQGKTSEHLEMVRDKFERGLAVSAEEVRVGQKGGGTAWVLLSLYLFPNVQGKRLGLMTLVDITKQKDIDIAKSEFVSLASHQLRTPIASMRWNTELLMMNSEHPLAPEQQEQADRLLRSIFRLSSLVDDFLSVSRFELGTLLPSLAPLDIDAFFADIINDQHVTFTKKQLVVEAPVAIGLRCVTDAQLLGMIVTNLFTNAIKYTPQGGTIKFGASLKNDLLVITVADNGMGIPVEEQSRLFTKMYRGSNAQRQVTDGTGLGLYIVKQACHVLGGNIAYNSGVGVGTAFTVTIPVGPAT